MDSLTKLDCSKLSEESPVFHRKTLILLHISTKLRRPGMSLLLLVHCLGVTAVSVNVE